VFICIWPVISVRQQRSCSNAQHSTAHLRALPAGFVPSPRSLQANCVSFINKPSGTSPRLVQVFLSRCQSPSPSVRTATSHYLGTGSGSWRLLACRNVRGCAQSLPSCRRSGPFVASFLSELSFVHLLSRLVPFPGPGTRRHR
jgi:hypothetical protein